MILWMQNDMSIEGWAWRKGRLILVLVPPTACLTLPRFRSRAVRQSLTTGASPPTGRHARDDKWTRGTATSSPDKRCGWHEKSNCYLSIESINNMKYYKSYMNIALEILCVRRPHLCIITLKSYIHNTI